MTASDSKTNRSRAPDKPKGPLPRLSDDTPIALDQMVKDRRHVPAMLNSDRARELIIALIERYAGAVDQGVRLRNERDSAQAELKRQEQGSYGVTTVAVERERALGFSVRTTTQQRQEIGWALGELGNSAARTAFRREVLGDLLELATEILELSSPLKRPSAEANDEIVASLRALIRGIQRAATSPEGVDLGPVVDQVCTRVAAAPDVIDEWLDALDAVADFSSQLWVRAAQQALVSGSSPPLPRRLKHRRDLEVELLASAMGGLVGPLRPRAATDLNFAVSHRDGFEVRASELSEATDPGWLAILPFTRGESAELAALWRAFVGSPAARDSPLGSALERVIRDEVSDRTGDLTVQRDDLESRLVETIDGRESAQREVAELREAVAAARQHAGATPKANSPLDVLEAAAELFNEVGRAPETSERTSLAVDRLRRLLSLERITSADGEFEEILPELFLFIGNAATSATRRVLRSAWITRDSAESDEVVLVSKGAIKFE